MERTVGGLKYFAMGDGPEAVICHPSLGLGRFLFYRLILGLSRHFRVMSYDPRGIGENAALAPDLEAWVEDVGDLMTLAGTRCHLIGVSLGTWVMSRAAVRWPDRTGRLVMMGTTPGFSNGASLVDARRRELATISMADFAQQYADATLTRFADSDIKQQLVMDLRGADADKYLASMAAIYLTDNTAVFEAVKAETLVVVGSLDARTPPQMADRAAQLIPESAVRIIPDAGHLALLDQPIRVQELIESFLRTGTIND